MRNHLLLYRSLTQAQKASSALDRAGVPNRIVRAPREVSGEGCSHCIRLAQEHAQRALDLLVSAGMDPRRIYATAADGTYEEVLF